MCCCVHSSLKGVENIYTKNISSLLAKTGDCLVLAVMKTFFYSFFVDNS